ncbi:RHS repeat-associated core domain-containing protein, partial [Streptomyces radiopugnans]|uniref:RHS repeat-associated core domain-containing protein n=1 Tax=Streptomyces radiopugnans TaxID=403935 RepID=UPI003F194D23
LPTWCYFLWNLRSQSPGVHDQGEASWSGYTSFRLNTGKPAAPTITCDPYTAQTWTAKAADGAQCTFDTTSTDGQGYYWGLNDPNTPSRINDTTDGTSGRPLTVTVKPGDGWHTLYAKTVDSGGNLSTSTTAYSFGVGDGAALLTPTDGERPARRVPLSSKGKSDYTGVIYQYRRGETDTWHTVPAADTTRASDGSAVTWPLAVTGGEPAKLIWNITDTLAEDGPIDIRAAFTDGSVTGYSQANTVTVDRNADIAASTEIGPGYLNLLTGDFKIPGTEGSYFGLSASRTASSRQPTAGGDQSGQAAIFGDEWVSSAVAGMSQTGYTHIRKTSSTSLDVVLEDGSSIYFTAKAGDANGWVPEPRAESLTLTGAFAEGFTLTDTDGTESAFAKVAADAETWQITSSGLKGITNSTTGVVSEAVTVDGKTLARPKLLVASGGAIATKTCAQTPSTRGCRVLGFEYADTTTATGSALGDYRGQLKNLKLWSTEKGDTRATTRTVQTYVYDTSGRLRETWNPQISPALKTAYDYDAAGRVTKVTPPGQLPWSFGYGNAGGTTAGDGMLTTVTRPTLQQGTASTTNGQAATSIVYDVPLSGDRAPYTMSASTVMKWGQLDFPTDATAVFPADTAPASHKGGELPADGYGRAVIHYLNTSGDEVNTIDEAGGVTTTEGDKHGNTVRQLTAGHHALALGTSDADRARLADLGISELSTAERARLLSTIMRYNSDGTRLLEQFKPLRRVDLTEDLKDGTTVLMPAGTSVIAQPWTVNEYDEGRPTDGSATVKDQLTMEISGARVLGYDSILADKRLTQTQYDWVKGLPVHSIEDPGGLDLVTTTEYDEQGRVTAHVPPGGTGQDASSRITTYWSAEGTGWCEGRPEWVGLECWNGPAGDITGGGDNPAQAVNTSTEYGFYGQLTEKTETSGGETRITTVTYDLAGRIKSTHIGGGLGTPITGTSMAYDGSNGQVSVMMSEGGGVIYQKVDALGRVISYTDADDAVTRTEYDALDRPVKVSNSVPSTVTYTYDHGKEPRGLATSMTDSVAGTFTAAYDVDGTVARQTLPGGHTMPQSGGKAGLPYQRAYTRDSDGTVLLTDTVTESIHEEWTSRAGGAGVSESQSYTYDTIGRLTKVEDTYNDVCTTRTYGFDQRTNRTSLTTAGAEAGAACTTSGGTQVTHAYDSADRIVDPGYTYDAFGRTTRMADGTSLAYYNNDLVQRQTSGHTRQSWTLDAAGRFRAWTTESDASGAWTRIGSKTNHYSSSSDSPRWITDNTDGSIVRMVGDLAGAMSATTGVSGPVVLQLANLHGDISLVLSLDESVAPAVLSSDEYGNQRSGNTARYSWLGTHQRSAETPSGTMLMGVRLYNPETGRFLSTDPVYGGSRNAYEYAGGNPVTNMDLDGRWYKKRTWYYSWGRLIGQYWSPSNWWSGSGHINLTAVFSKRWTGRVADYGWYSYLVVGAVGAIVAALFPAAVLAIVAITALVELSWGTIQLVATWARNRGQCLGITMGASIKHKWGVPRYAYSRYVSPWRFRC